MWTDLQMFARNVLSVCIYVRWTHILIQTRLRLVIHVPHATPTLHPTLKVGIHRVYSVNEITSTPYYKYQDQPHSTQSSSNKYNIIHAETDDERRMFAPHYAALNEEISHLTMKIQRFGVAALRLYIDFYIYNTYIVII